MLKKELEPLGEKDGQIFLNGKEYDENSAFSSQKVGFVMQRPEEQIVTDKVWHELSFGLENLGVSPDIIRRRVAETASFFGIEDLYDRDVFSLSGGQKQLLNLAACMVSEPDILVLDEPTAQLDPIAASGLLNIIKKMNEELSLTVIITEHRLDNVLPLGNKLMVLENGEIKQFGLTRDVCAKITQNTDAFNMMPAAVRLFSRLEITDIPCALTVSEARKAVTERYNNDIRSVVRQPEKSSDENALELKNVSFRFSRDGGDILDNVSFGVKKNEIMCILGGNGSGKTTTLRAAAGLIKPYAGKIKVFSKKLSDYKGCSLYDGCISFMPQDVQTLFIMNTVEDELKECNADISKFPFDFSCLLKLHPYDLSGGEQQILGLAKVLASSPKLVLLDEPTKGLDANAVRLFVKIIKALKADGLTFLIVTHDVEFAAMCADRCALFFRGAVVSQCAPVEFFSQNNFYTTSASRISRGFYDGAYTVDEVAELCDLNGRAGDKNDCD